MRRMARIARAWHFVTLGLLVSLWLGISCLLVVARGNPEAFLLRNFGRFSRADAFEHLNGISVALWWVHSFLVVVAILATRCRRKDVLAVLTIGPIMALAFAVFWQQWSDPNWFEVVAVWEICSLVSTIVGQAYWVVKP
jgi:hypothetical protein